MFTYGKFVNAEGIELKFCRLFVVEIEHNLLLKHFTQQDIMLLRT